MVVVQSGVKVRFDLSLPPVFTRECAEQLEADLINQQIYVVRRDLMQDEKKYSLLDLCCSLYYLLGFLLYPTVKTTRPKVKNYLIQI